MKKNKKQKTKNKKTPKRPLLLFFLLFIFYFLLSTSCLFADYGIVGGGARVFGLNYAFTAMADDTNAIFINPAGLGQIKKGMFGSSYRKLFMNLSDNSDLYDSAAEIAYPFEKIGVIGVGWYNFALSDYYTENIYIITYSCNLSRYFLKNLTRPFFTGVNLKYLSKEYVKDSYTSSDSLFMEKGYGKSAFSADFGLLCNLADNYFIGVALTDINQPNVDLGDRKTNIPICYKLGFAYKTDRISFDTDIIRKNEELRGYAGLEKPLLREHFVLRAGIGIGNRQYRSGSLGAGYRSSVIQIDYGFSYPLAGITETIGNHSMSLNFLFNFYASETKEEAQKLKTKKQKLKEQDIKKEEIIKQEPQKIETIQPQIIPSVINMSVKYIVRQGDTLTSIAESPEIYNDPKQWRKIYNANREKISPTFGVEPGVELIIPRD